jgi:predicted dehydrogenase
MMRIGDVENDIARGTSPFARARFTLLSFPSTLCGMIRVGIIGMGFMGRVHYGTYEKIPGVQVVAIADADPRRAAGDLSGGWGNIEADKANQLPMDRIRGTTDYREMLTWADIDAVDICLPTPAHVGIVPEALAAGKHVICEKPLARTSADARIIAAAAEARRDLVFMPAMCMRFWAEWEWLKRAVDEKRYGAVRSATFRRVGSIPAGWFRDGAASGGGLLDLHIHDTDFIYHLFGKPRAVFSTGYAGLSGEIDHLVTQYLYENGPALVSAEGSWTQAEGFGFSMRYTVNFEKATADFDLFRGEGKTLMLSHDGKSEPVQTDTHNGYVGELSYFTECVRMKTQPARVTAQDGVNGLLIAEAERRSVASGNIEVVE